MRTFEGRVFLHPKSFRFLAPAPLTDQNAQGELDWGRQLYQRGCIDLPFLEGGRASPAGSSWTPLSAKELVYQEPAAAFWSCVGRERALHSWRGQPGRAGAWMTGYGSPKGIVALLRLRS